MAKKKNTPKDTPVNLARFTMAYVNERREALIESAGNRNELMDRYEKMYRLRMWQNAPADGEKRVTLPLAYDIVEKYNALIFGRLPQISVPPISNEPAAKGAAEKLESYLYGMADRVNLWGVMRHTEWNANLLGRGWLKGTYQPNAAVDEFPIEVIAPDPRCVYAFWNARRDEPVELVQTYERTRREIEAEWDVDLSLTEKKGKWNAVKDYEAWRDEAVDYNEYWKIEVVWDEQKEQSPALEEPDQLETTPVMEMAAEKIAGAGDSTGHTSASGPTIGESMAGAGMLDGTTRKAEDKKTREKKRIKKVVHCAWVGTSEDDGVWCKKPVVVVGYEHIPYYGWCGVDTPMDEGRDALSVLYPLTNGDESGDMAMGVLQAYNLLASIDLDEAVKRATLKQVTDDDTADDDGEVVTVKAGRRYEYMAAPPNNSSVPRVGEMLSRTIDRVATPEVLNGQVFSLSGQAIRGLSNAFQMSLAVRQHARQMALQKFFGHVLTMTREYADLKEGWQAYGRGRWGKFVEATIKPADVGASTRVQVALSASMPNDEVGLMSMMSNMQRGGQLSLETLLDQFQRLFGMASDTPMEEMERILRDKYLMEGEVAKQVAAALAEQLVAMVKEGAGVKSAPPSPPPPAPSPAPQREGDGGINMAGMPITPQTVAAMGNPLGAMNMMSNAGIRGG